MEDFKFSPFYEKLLGRVSDNFLGKIFTSIALGAIFIVPHYICVRGGISNDWSWFLAILICVAMLCLYYATHALRALLPQMGARIPSDQADVYLVPLKNILSNRNFIRAGLFFGVLNCGFGLLFGVPGEIFFGAMTMIVGYFLVGFVCGMAAFGILGVCYVISAFAQKTKISFDFTSPDRCGGSLFLGNALLIFSSVTLIVGVMISIYILKEDWGNKNTWWVISLKFFWIVFPYLMSITALIAPAIPINKAMRRYKVEQGEIIQNRLNDIRVLLEQSTEILDKQRALRESYEFQTSLRVELHAMRTWPFSLGSNLKYLTVFAPNLLATVKTTWSWVDGRFIS